MTRTCKGRWLILFFARAACSSAFHLFPEFELFYLLHGSEFELGATALIGFLIIKLTVHSAFPPAIKNSEAAELLFQGNK